ncbi:MAG: hypothetical protein WCJ56_11330 [bacterium]
MRNFWLVLLVTIVVIFLAGCGKGGDGRAAASLSAEELLAGLPSPAEIQQVVTAPSAEWWGNMPEVFAGTARPDTALPGENIFVARRYAPPSLPDGTWVEATLVTFSDDKAAHDAFVKIAATSDKNAVTIAGETSDGVDELRYFTLEEVGRIKTTTLRYRVGAVLGRITLSLPLVREQEKLLAALGKIAVPHVYDLLSGKLTVAALPVEKTMLLPADSATEKEIGPAISTFSAPTEAWALYDATGKASDVNKALREGGVKEVVTRRNAIAGLPGHALEVSYLRFADAAAASAWVKRSINSRNKGLDLGKIIPQPSFFMLTKADGFSGVYQYQFCKGNIVADLTAWNVKGGDAQTDAKCEVILRSWAEQWYLILYRW